MPEPGGKKNLASAITAIADAVAAEEGSMTDRKRRIIEAAILCFAEKGYEATPTAEIARRAGVAEATIFRHFPTKKDLLLRLVKPIAGRLLVPAVRAEVEAMKREAKGDFRKLAILILKNRLQFADRYGPLLRIVAQEMPLHPELRQMATENLLPGFETIIETVEEFKAAGQIRDLPPARLLRWFGSLFLGYYLIRSATPELGWDDEAEIEATVDFLLRGASLAL